MLGPICSICMADIRTIELDKVLVLTSGILAGNWARTQLCYLGRESDGTDTLAKALAHWEHHGRQTMRICGR